MSELPWEMKKDSKNGSEGQANSGSDNFFPPGLGAASNIPDILANAFAEVPMEEAKLDISSSIAENEGNPVMPSFLDTINTIVSDTENDVAIPQFESESPLPAGQMPPFLQESGINSENNPIPAGATSHPKPPLFDLSSLSGTSSATSDGANSTPVSKPARKSPPPIFNPDFLDDNDANKESGSMSPPDMASAPFPPSAPVSDSPFPPVAPVNDSPFPPVAPVNDSPFPPVAPVNDSPFPPVAPVSDSPFPPVAPVSDSPFPPSSPVSDSPFPPSSPVSDSPFPPVAPVNDSPFPPVAPVNDSPFPPVAPVNDSPFPPSSSVSDSPFPPVAPVGDSPFPPVAPVSDSPFPPSSPVQNNIFKSSKSIVSSLKVEGLTNNLDGIGTAVKSLFKSLTQGKSLIERMHEFQDDSVPVTGDVSSISEFGASSDNPFLNNEASVTVSGNPFEKPHNNDILVPEEPVLNVGGSGNSSYLKNLDADLIRKVTPIADPLFEIKDEYKIDDVILPKADDHPNIVKGAVDEGVISSLSDNSVVENGFIADLDDASSLKDASDVPDLLDMPGNSVYISKDDIELVRNISSDVHEMKLRIESSESRYKDVESSVSILSNVVSDLNSDVSLSEKNAELIAGANDNLISLNEKVGTIADNITTLESAMHMLKSDKDSMCLDLLRMEDNIAELVNSYTALLVQVHESSEVSDTRLSKLESSLELMGQFEERFVNIEHAQVESTSTSRELAKSISSLVDEFGTSSSELESFKESSSQRSDELANSIGSVTEYLDSELKKLGARSYKGFGQNVHLSNIVKNSGNMKLCMEWLEFLMELVGRNNLSDILSYYEELGWITEDVRMELINYAEGIDFYMEKPDWKLTPNDHVKSIWFIESLAGMKVDKNRLSVIDRDIEKVKKGTEIYGI